MLWVLLYSFLAGFSLSIFAQMDAVVRYIFSLLALYIGIRFFRRFETIGMRVLFVVLAIVFYFVSAIGFSFYFYMQDHPELMTSTL